MEQLLLMQRLVDALSNSKVSWSHYNGDWRWIDINVSFQIREAQDGYKLIRIVNGKEDECLPTLFPTEQMAAEVLKLLIVSWKEGFEKGRSMGIPIG